MIKQVKQTGKMVLIFNGQKQYTWQMLL